MSVVKTQQTFIHFCCRQQNQCWESGQATARFCWLYFRCRWLTGWSQGDENLTHTPLSVQHLFILVSRDNQPSCTWIWLLNSCNDICGLLDIKHHQLRTALHGIVIVCLCVNSRAGKNVFTMMVVYSISITVSGSWAVSRIMLFVLHFFFLHSLLWCCWLDDDKDSQLLKKCSINPKSLPAGDPAWGCG